MSYTNKALKRRRESSPPDDNELVRHETLYLEDGDIVLTAPIAGGQKRLVFRVDKIFLARHSLVFKDMLAFEPGQGSEDVYEGVPRVDLTDDADDLAMLLGGMYDMSTLLSLLHKLDPDKPTTMRGVVRLATKYEIEGIRRTIIAQVEDDWPQALDAYDAWHTDNARIAQTHPSDFWRHVPEPAAAMQFATEFNCTKITTAIMYSLARHPVDFFLPCEQPNMPNLQPHRVRWYLLDAMNLFRVLKAQAIYKEYRHTVKHICIQQAYFCVATGECLQKVTDYVDITLHASYDLLRFCAADLVRSSPGALCNGCIRNLMGLAATISDLKTKLWSAMQECASSEPIPWPVKLPAPQKYS